MATNGLPFDTKIELEGFGICRVVDRMNARYGAGYIDVSFDKDLHGALAFGRKNLTYNVID